MPINDENAQGNELLDARAEIGRLREENQRLKKLLEIRASVPGVVSGAHLSSAPVTTKSSTQDKIRLFQNLFRGRDDVSAVRWEGKNGKGGYSLACIRDSRIFFLAKAEAIKQRQLLPLTDQFIHDHLSRKLTAGIYSLLRNETCWFLALDFDKATWPDDVFLPHSFANKLVGPELDCALFGDGHKSSSPERRRPYVPTSEKRLEYPPDSIQMVANKCRKSW